jgi:hypothetical protein
LDHRRARRTLWAIRLIFYPGAAVIAFLLLTGGKDPALPLVGETRQGHAFVMGIDGDRPLWFETAVTETCPDGRTIEYPWSSSSQLILRDGVVQAETASPVQWSGGRYGTRSMYLMARVDDDGATGTLWMTDTLGDITCESRPVRFSARPQR